MEKDDLLDRLLDATLDGDDVDHESFLSEGGEELAGAVLAVVDDFKLPNKRGKVHDRLKEWVTARWISIHGKGLKP